MWALTLSALSWRFLKANGSVDGQKQNKEGASIKLPVLLILLYSIRKAALHLALMAFRPGEEGLSPKLTDQPALPGKHPTVLFLRSSLTCIYVMFAQKMSSDLLRKNHFKN